jgi:hypothetical protein
LHGGKSPEVIKLMNNLNGLNYSDSKDLSFENPVAGRILNSSMESYIRRDASGS